MHAYKKMLTYIYRTHPDVSVQFSCVTGNNVVFMVNQKLKVYGPMVSFQYLQLH